MGTILNFSNKLNNSDKYRNARPLTFGKSIPFPDHRFEVVAYKIHIVTVGYAVGLYTRMIGDTRPPTANEAIIPFPTENDRDLFYNNFSQSQAMDYLEGQAAMLRNKKGL